MRPIMAKVLPVFLFVFVMIGAGFRVDAAPARIEKKEQLPPASYLQALRTANAFLWAWVDRDSDIGLRLLSDHLRAEIKDESWLRQFVEGLSNPHHQAFEIDRGRARSGNQYSFPVTLYEYYTGEQEGAEYRSTLLVIKQGDTWRVGQLPRSSDNP